jgi:hypothetical protein
VRQLVASDAAAGDLFGASIAMARDMVLIGAPGSGDAGPRSGTVYLFQRGFGGAGSLLEVRKLTASDAGPEDHLGSSVALARGAALAGAPGPPAGTLGGPVGGGGAGGAYLFAASNGPFCSSAPATDCIASWESGLLRVNEKVPGQERIVVRFRGAPVLVQADFGNPLPVSGTVYRLCLYNDSGAPLGPLGVYAGSTCGDTPCWRPLGALPPDGTGFEYEGDNQHLRLHAGTRRSELLYEATAPFVAGLASRLSEHTTVQLVPEAGPACFSLTMSRVKGGRGFFKAKK